VDAARFHTQEGRLEEGFRATEPLVTDGDDLPRERRGSARSRVTDVKASKWQVHT
jgi:hypothetical protein